MTNYKFDHYDTYKDSHIEGLGVIPDHWKIARLKEVSDINKSTLSENTLPEYDFNYVDIGSVTYGMKGYVKEAMTFSAAPSRARRIVKMGDTIISTVRTYLKAVTSIDEDVSDLIVSTGFAVVSPKKKIDNKYCSYQLTSEFIIDEISASSKGVSYPATNASSIGNLLLLIPTFKEQVAIASYLNKKTEQIDCKIDLLNQKAKRYEMLKESLINETVTRGLDKAVAMKDSGIKWIGTVPSHWDVKRIADIAKQNKVKNVGTLEKNLLSLSYGRIIRKDFNSSFGLLPESFETYQIVKQGSIILRLTDLQNDQKSLRVGHVSEKGIITSAYLGLVFSKKINSKFAYYLLHVFDLCKVFYWFGGGLRSTMRYEDVKIIPFMIPPLIEQKAIADYLDDRTAKIDQIVVTINDQIEKLKELRKTLINDVVTGKLKVTNEGLAA